MEQVYSFVEKSDSLIIDLQSELTRIPAMSPDSGGDGETKKATRLKEIISSWGFDSIDEYFAPDSRVSSGTRPSMVATINGKSHERSLWFISHLDVVPPGDEALWDTPPFEAVVKGDKIYGRGTEDNQQGIVASLVAVKALLSSGVTPAVDVKLLFVADEEVGSEYGMQWLLDNTTLFGKNDYIITPDVGDPAGDFIEVAEKSIMWMEFSIVGRQSHGSRPDLGVNAAKASSRFCVAMERLYEKFDSKDTKYDVPYSTFEPTKRVGSVTNFNTIPGMETICFDCRVLPCYKLSEVLAEIDRIIADISKSSNVLITYTFGQKQDAPAPTSEDAPVVRLLSDSIKEVLGKTPKCYGIGGGTVAACFRERGIDAALWSTLDNTMHAPNEYSSIKNTKQDASVFACMMLSVM